ncbi:MAG: serine/threonine-protein kinase [Bryobacterales bacterium]
MDRALHRRARDVFLEACNRFGEDRARFVAQACGGDEALRGEVEALLEEIGERGPLDASGLPGLSHPADVFEQGATVAGRFEVIRLLGRGGMGEVYEARDLTLKDRVALKTMRADWLGEPAARRRFLREIRLARTVSHPAVCRVYDHALHETPEGSVDLVSMQLLEGRTLAEILEAERPDLAASFAIAAKLAEGLDAAHRAGVLHLDLKPANVIVLEDGADSPRVVITDFGIARSIGADASTIALGGEARPIGTPQYMAPEQLRGEEPTAAADIYSFGTVLYELAVGRRPFSARFPEEAQQERATRAAALVSEVREEAGASWARAVEECLKAAPEERPESGEAVIALLEGRSPSRRPGQWIGRRAAMAAAALALTLGALTAALRPALMHPVLSWIESQWVAPLPKEARLAMLPFDVSGIGAPRASSQTAWRLQ